MVTEGPFEELINQCDVVTSTCLVGSSNIFLQSAMLSATIAASQPFGLPCILHTHPTRRSWEYNQPWPVGMECSLTPLDRLSSDSLMPNSFSEQREGSNGDWIVTVGRRATRILSTCTLVTRLLFHLCRGLKPPRAEPVKSKTLFEI